MKLISYSFIFAVTLPREIFSERISERPGSAELGEETDTCKFSRVTTDNLRGGTLNVHNGVTQLRGFNDIKRLEDHVFKKFGNRYERQQLRSLPRSFYSA